MKKSTKLAGAWRKLPNFWKVMNFFILYRLSIFYTLSFVYFGSVTPDKWKDFPHHHGKSGKIKKYVLEARRLFLSDDLAEACFCLGVSLHYIQDQIIFYRVLSSYKAFPKINPDTLEEPQQLNEYFANVLKENYSPIFSFGVSSEFSKKSIPAFKNVIKFVYSLSPENLDREILGKLFHRLIPLEIRKPLGAYYTLVEAANILANLAIENCCRISNSSLLSHSSS